VSIEAARPPLGLRSPSISPEDQNECFKELATKLAWALGSTYKVPYTNHKTSARSLAVRMAHHLLDTQGFPRHREGL